MRLINDDDSSSSKEYNYQYQPQAPNSVTLSTISQSSQKGLDRIGNDPRFAQMSLKVIFIFINESFRKYMKNESIQIEKAGVNTYV